LRRLPLLLAGGALWLFLAAIPALADGGPHVMDVNNGTLGLNSDGCAGCHRVHTAQGPLLLKASSDTTLCLTCHGAAGTGATTDVMTGVQYQLSGTPGEVRGGTQLGALRGGGYDEARLGEPTKLIGPTRPMVAVGPAEPVTSAHLDLDGGGGVVARNIAWGNGQNGTGVGPTVELGCVSCHNPHGNGNYRILRPIPTLEGTQEADTVTYDILLSDAALDRIYLVSTPPLLVGDPVTIAGNSGAGVNGTGTVSEVGNDNYRTYVKLTGVDITSGGTGGTLVRDSGRVVTDGAPPGPGDVRNYTVIQTSTIPLLYASQVLKGGSKMDIVEIGSSNAGTNVITTVVPHGLSPGNTVDVVSHDGAGANGIGLTVDTTPSATTFTLTGVDITTDGGNFGWVTRAYTVASYASSDGDYFHRYEEWYSGSGTDNPVETNVTAELFDNQITQWCSTCHTRYYAWQNLETQEDVASADAGTDVITTATAHGLVTNQQITFTGADIGGIVNGNRYYVKTAPTATTFTVSTSSTNGVPGATFNLTSNGTGVGQILSWGPAYEVERPGDDIYKFQHRTRSNRACTTCHVAHGSNAPMTGTYSASFPYPGDTITSDSSRLLKVENRGTCQLCHDPTETALTGWFLGASSSVNAIAVPTPTPTPTP
jgi:predicted CXXCH cytochrome family protein